jgi:hypothetical protein
VSGHSHCADCGDSLGVANVLDADGLPRKLSIGGTQSVRLFKRAHDTVEIAYCTPCLNAQMAADVAEASAELAHQATRLAAATAKRRPRRA